MLDATAEILTEDEMLLLKQMPERRGIAVVNKTDLPRGAAVGQAKEILTDRLLPVETSAITGDGIVELRQKILDSIRGEGKGAAAESETGLMTNLRQQQAVGAALQALRAGQAAICDHVPHEMLLLDLYGALGELDRLTGETTADDILNLIFSTFCIGK